MMAKSNFKHLRDSIEASWESIIPRCLSSSSFCSILIDPSPFFPHRHLVSSRWLLSFLGERVDSFGLPMMFREQLCGSLGHEAWLLWGHRPLSHRTTIPLAKKRWRGTTGIIM